MYTTMILERRIMNVQYIQHVSAAELAEFMQIDTGVKNAICVVMYYLPRLAPVAQEQVLDTALSSVDGLFAAAQQLEQFFTNS
jgi:hypothetical protein